MNRESDNAMPKWVQRDVLDEETERFDALTPEQRRRDLVARGVDPKRLDALADQLYAMFGEHVTLGPRAIAANAPVPAPDNASVERAAHGGEPSAQRATRKRWMITGAASLAAVASTLALVTANLSGPASVTVEGPIMSYSARVPPWEQRALGLDDCARGNWADMLRHFDEAKSDDPRGDNDPRVQQCRRRGTAALAAAAVSDAGASAGDR